MKSQLRRNWVLPQTWLRFVFIILLVLGVFFRFVNLDRKTYWGDEVHTSLRISGYTLAEMSQELRNGRVVSINNLQKYQYTTPKKSAVDTINSLALEDSQHVPLYYVMARFWVQWFGNSVAVTRSFSAFISLLTFPLLYWLCKELFESSLIGWIAVALIAVSPFHVLYAQEARPYSLYVVTILLSSVALQRAMRVKTNVSWVIYSTTVSLGFYTQLFFGLVAIGHGIYLAVMERFRLSKTLVSYLIASLAGLLTFMPWIFVIINAPAKFDAQNWMNTKSSLLSSSTRWAGIISRAFLDLGFGPDDSLKQLIPLIPFILTLLALIIYSIYFLCRHSSKRAWLFVLTLIGLTGLAFMLPDFVLGRRYATTRFLTPCILGIQLSIVYLLASKTTSLSVSNQRQKLWQIVAALLVSGGVISCAISSQAESWWNKAPADNKYNSHIAYLVNQATQPLLIKDGDLIPLYTLSYLLEPKVKFQLVAESDIPEIPEGFSEVFLLKPSESLRSGLERKYKLHRELIDGSLWKLEDRE